MLLLALVRFNALYQINSYDPQLEKFAVNSFDFRFCNITCQVGSFRVSWRFINAEENKKINLFKKNALNNA